MTRDYHRPPFWFWAAAVMCGLILLITLVGKNVGCSVKPKKAEVGPPAPTADVGEDDGSDVVEPPPPPPPLEPCDTVITFDEIAPVIGLNCASCHPGFDTFPVAQEKIDVMLGRIEIKAGLPGHMPAGRGDLAETDIARFTGWKSDGFLKAGDCVKGDTGARDFYDFAWLEEKTFTAAAAEPFVDQANVRFLVAIDLLNLGRLDDLAVELAQL